MRLIRSIYRRHWPQPRLIIRSLGGRLRRGVDAIALTCCRPLVPTSRRRERHARLAAIHATAPPALVAARTVLAALLTGGAAGVATLFGVVLLFRSEPAVVRPLIGRLGVAAFPPWLSLGVAVGGGLIAAIAVAVAVYRLRWLLIERRAVARSRQIDRTLPRAVAFMYALAGSGMPLPAVLRTLAAHEAIYGETAVAIGVTVREIDRFGADVITALELTSDRTPSAELAEFTADLAAVVEGGQPIDDYLRQQHDQYREAAADSQQGFLDRLATAAEGYVTCLVVGPLFVITTLTIVGLVVTETVFLLRVITFGLLPIGTVGSLIVIDRLLADRRAPTAATDERHPHQRAPEPPGGHSQPTATPSDRTWERQRAMLRLTDHLSGCRRWLRRPATTLGANPWLTLLVTVPLGLWWLVAVTDLPRSPAAMATATRPLSIALIVICGGYAAAYEIGAARQRRLTAAVPVFLDRLAGVNEAGLSVVDGLERVADGELGALSEPLARTRRDVRWGADVTSALRRLAQRVRSPSVTGAVALVTNALRASNRIGPVATIAAAELRAAQRLARRRRRAMATYLVVIYVAFLVFLGIIAALSVSFIPAIATADVATGGLPTAGVPGAGVGSVGRVTASVDPYETLLAQVTTVQAICSGFVAGHLGEGEVRAGVKHVAVLLVLAQIVFWFI